MNKGFAFIDNGGVLHVVSDKEDAVRNSVNGKVVATGIERRGGYPAVSGEQIVIYGVDECYVEGNRNGGTPLKTSVAFPVLAALYKEIMG